MKKRSVLVLLGAAIVASSAQAGVYHFSPSDPDLADLPHEYYYKWTINWTVPDGEYISGASLLFDNIRNWTYEANVLYSRLLSSGPGGVRQYADWEYPADAFAGQGVSLVTYYNIPSRPPQDLVHYLTTDQLSALSSYSQDGNFAIGIDPDCHFYNDGVRLTIETAQVPAPGAVVLGMGGFGAVSAIRHRLG